MLITFKGVMYNTEQKNLPTELKQFLSQMKEVKPVEKLKVQKEAKVSVIKEERV